MKALVIIDAQNEFTAIGNRPIPNIQSAVAAIQKLIMQARLSDTPIVWIRHFNKPNESSAFMPGSWGSNFIDGLKPDYDSDNETEMHKDVYGAFTGTKIGEWLKERDVDEITITGFYTHGCVSTTSREAIMLGLKVNIDPDATATCELKNDLLGVLSAEESKRAAIMQLLNMGVALAHSLKNELLAFE